jgi:hypothetical protein
MSTEFLSTTTGELGFVRFGRSAAGFRTSFEFGTVTNFEQVLAAVRSGDRFEPLGDITLDSDPETAEDLEALVANGRGTFGVFPIVVALGSGEMFRFTVEQ